MIAHPLVSGGTGDPRPDAVQLAEGRGQGENSRERPEGLERVRVFWLKFRCAENPAGHSKSGAPFGRVSFFAQVRRGSGSAAARRGPREYDCQRSQDPEGASGETRRTPNRFAKSSAGERNIVLPAPVGPMLASHLDKVVGPHADAFLFTSPLAHQCDLRRSGRRSIRSVRSVRGRFPLRSFGHQKYAPLAVIPDSR